MRGLIALGVVAAAAATSACDLVFPPAQLAEVDADPTAPDGADEPDAPPGTPDGPPGEPDAPPGQPDAKVSVPDADTCVLECLGAFGGDGVTGCAPAANDWCGDPALDTLDPYDLCNCTSGTPSLIVFDVTAGNLRLALLPAFANTWWLSVDGVGCVAPTTACSIESVCASPPSQLVFYDGIEPSGGSMELRFWFDDTCTAGGTTFFYDP